MVKVNPWMSSIILFFSNTITSMLTAAISGIAPSPCWMITPYGVGEKNLLWKEVEVGEIKKLDVSAFKPSYQRIWQKK